MPRCYEIEDMKCYLHWMYTVCLLYFFLRKAVLTCNLSQIDQSFNANKNKIISKSWFAFVLECLTISDESCFNYVMYDNLWLSKIDKAEFGWWGDFDQSLSMEEPMRMMWSRNTRVLKIWQVSHCMAKKGAKSDTRKAKTGFYDCWNANKILRFFWESIVVVVLFEIHMMHMICRWHPNCAGTKEQSRGSGK